MAGMKALKLNYNRHDFEYSFIAEILLILLFLFMRYSIFDIYVLTPTLIFQYFLISPRHIFQTYAKTYKLP